ncbi:MAG: GxxExxY protein [Deltaproteobacteria bacterium]|nr:GxxExxY protein [Deltaproteobacteria bacterium]
MAYQRTYKIIGAALKVQLINYLKATCLKVGMLINFGAKSLEHKRFVYNLRKSA